ncbi:TIGR04197 family type VII secretion effector [Listeria sp. FSL L7-1509]|uniref:TIGR04197 family type VII secretion effector n=1 Tax=Listeria immobilis TaxID=2713502 RepID=A0ABR6STU4_9LIST|nr:TIGR04197 family type VII secretion effector [Listeria immobilis]MBC1482073.1 TIGR04197 family type VII secretion effector [Listeria immobilis]MBC1505464.1 TIGR04197 family type VII secretion effector [Listeria immobilis]MBC1509103.1 TIGR04197 family type VII secretion effector [Listeria immobilis]MBC6303948.1 TIGR04197 family type VII secretion effector [Listeria immobilis]MBC6312286.1 TIGR04197 family type VII secretion effector [Listeria immobilis]
MSTVASDLGQATEKATALQQAVSILQKQGTTTMKDEETTVGRNTQAHTAIQAEGKAATQIASALTMASTNLHSVAEAFAAKDAELGANLSTIGGSTP